MEIHYCSECSSRIQEGDARFVEGTAYCATCHHKKFPKTSRTGLKPAGRRSTPTKATKPPTEHLSRPGTGAVIRSGAHRAPSVRASRNGSTSSGSMAVIGGVCAALVLVPLLFLVLSPSREATPEKRPAKAEPAVPQSTSATPTQGGASAAPATKTQTDPMAEIREGVARRKYDDILKDERDGKLDGNRLRKALSDFLVDYASTTVGRQAADKLQGLPPASPEPEAPAPRPPEPTVPEAGAPAGVLFSSTFDTDVDFRCVEKGERTDKGGFDRGGQSVASVAEKSDYFTSRITIRANSGTPVQPDTWVHFALFVEEGDNQVCLHSGIGDGIYEKYLPNLPKNQWTWVSFRMRDYAKNLKINRLEVPSGTFNFTAIFGCGAGGKRTRVLVDDFSIGNGPMP